LAASDRAAAVFSSKIGSLPIFSVPFGDHEQGDSTGEGLRLNYLDSDSAYAGYAKLVDSWQDAYGDAGFSDYGALEASCPSRCWIRWKALITPLLFFLGAPPPPFDPLDMTQPLPSEYPCVVMENSSSSDLLCFRHPTCTSTFDIWTCQERPVVFGLTRRRVPENTRK
jgi:hypothetical protein